MSRNAMSDQPSGGEASSVSSESTSTTTFKKLPPAQPVYILRGHTTAIHSIEFIRCNTRLITGDAEGWVVLWDVVTKRPAVVWKAHGNAILRSTAWGRDKIITHGRDQKLLVWKLDLSDEAIMSKVLPADEQQRSHHRQQPWLLHALNVNTLNFCSFAMCETRDRPPYVGSERDDESDAVLIAVPSASDSDGIDIFQLPSENRIHVIPKNSFIKTGMVMALALFHHRDNLYVVAGYESGHTKVFQNDCVDDIWKQIYSHQSHSQPVLSLSIMPCRDHYFTSSADAIVAKHTLPIDKQNREQADPQKIDTRHSGQQGLTVRSDGKIFATAGWDSRIRVYATSSMMELAVLKWHKDGCYTTAFAEMEANHESWSIQQKRSSEVDEQALVTKEGSNPRVLSERRRSEKAWSTHWLAAGSKDGKISLWDIY